MHSSFKHPALIHLHKHTEILTLTSDLGTATSQEQRHKDSWCAPAWQTQTWARVQSHYTSPHGAHAGRCSALGLRTLSTDTATKKVSLPRSTNSPPFIFFFPSPTCFLWELVLTGVWEHQQILMLVCPSLHIRQEKAKGVRHRQRRGRRLLH